MHMYNPSPYHVSVIVFRFLFDLQFEFIGVTSNPINRAECLAPLLTHSHTHAHTMVIGFITGRLLSSCSLCEMRGVEMKFSCRKALLLPGI